MVSAEHHQQRSGSGRDQHEPLLGERIGVQVPATASPVADGVLLRLIDAVQYREIEVGRAGDALEIGVAQEIISGVLPYVTGVYILVGSTCR